ncbi:MAG: lysophospholipid acyltransferase family protein [Planctomycetota bacterium]
MRRNARKRARNRVLLALGRVLFDRIGRLEPETASRIGAALGRLGYCFLGPARRRVYEHLALAFDEPAGSHRHRRIALAAFTNFAANAFEWIAWLPRGSKLAAASIREVRGMEHMVRARAAGRGALLVTAHFGLFEMMPAALGREIKPAVVIGRKPADESFDAFVTENRARMDVRTIPQSAAREILRVLKKGGVAGVLPDQDIDKLPGIFVPFFGRDAWTPTGPASVSVMTGAPLVPLFIYREGPACHRIEIHEPIEDPGGTKEERVRALTEEINRRIEAVIRETPGHWAWFHERWQTTPEKLERRRKRRARIAKQRRERENGAS